MRRAKARPRVLQMLPADGWRGVWANEDGTTWDDPLVCWALVDYTEVEAEVGDDADFWPAVSRANQAIVGMVTGADGWIDTPEGDNFLGYSPSSESLDVWADQAKSYSERQARKKAQP